MLKTGLPANIFYYYALLLILFFMIRDAWYYGITVNYFGFFILFLELIFFLLVLQKGIYLRITLLGWSLLIMLKNFLPLIGMVLEHSHNRFIDADLETLSARILRFSLSISVLVGTFYFTLPMLKDIMFENRDDSLHDEEE